MANDFYNRGASFNPGEVADGDAIEAEFDAVSRGFDTIEELVNANRAGYPSQTFHVAPAVKSTHAIQKAQLDSAVSDLTDEINTKLDAVDYNAPDVLAKMKTVDGAGSGLDADLLDGLHESQFLRSDVADTINATLTLASGANIKLANTYNYGIRDSNNARALDVADGVLRLGDSASHSILRLHTTSLTGFRANVSGVDYTLWHAGNDGSSSGLDADLLDGIHASQFLRSDVNATSTSTISATQFIATLNSVGKNIGVGNDAWLGDVDISNTIRLMGQQDNTKGYLIFGNGNSEALGRSGTGALTYGGNTIWHAGNDGSSSGLDADMVDGLHGSQLVRNDTTNSSVPVSINNGGLYSGNGDGCSSTVNNVKLQSWYGIGFSPSITGQLIPNGEYSHYFNVRTGEMTARGTITATQFIATLNSVGKNIGVGNDAWLGDVDISNTIRLMGQQDNTKGYLIFGNGNSEALGRSGTGALTYGGNTIWHAGNDGSSSGLDADLLDGIHASQFLRSDVNATMSADILMAGSNPLILFTPSGANDCGGIRFNYTNNDGVMEFFTSDDYAEPFVWRAYDIGCSLDTAGTGTYQELMKLDVGGLSVMGNIGVHGTYIYGDGKSMLRFDDSWLRLNPDNAFDNGIYAGTGLFRTDGAFQIGPNGATLNITGSTFTYLGNKVFHAGNDGSGSGLNADMVDGLHGSQLVRNDTTNSSVPVSINNGGLYSGNGDGCSSTVNNVKLQSWYGIGFSPSITGQLIPNGEYSHYFNVRTGEMTARGTITAPTFSGALSGNASSATKLQTARTIALSGDVTGSVAFDGSADMTISTLLNAASVASIIANMGAGSVGSVAILQYTVASGVLTFGATYEGSKLRAHGFYPSSSTASSAITQDGTWKCLSQQAGISGQYPSGLFLRIS